ncbi:MAG: serine/threonine-protein kinase [Synechocystis sp.]
MITTANVAVMPLFPRSRYRIIGQIGQGQFGRVYCALERSTGKIYALKDLEHRVFPTNKFLREVSYLVMLRHPNIVACHALEYHAGGRYLVMDYCEGGTLRDVIDGDGDLCLAGKINLIHQMLLGLEQAHKYNIIHCDLKPDNILLVPRQQGWQVKVSDFGIARLTEATGNPNFGKGYTGSPAYMAPERFYGKFSVASDIYAAGIMLYELIVGHRPFSGFPKAIQAAHLNQRVELPADFPDIVAPIVSKALEKLPQRRYGTAIAMAKALETVQQHLSPPNTPISVYQNQPPERLDFAVTVKHSTPLLFAITTLVSDGLWLYLGNGRELYLWEYHDPTLADHPRPRWSLGVPGGIKTLVVNQGHISLLTQDDDRHSWQFFQWQDKLLLAPKLPKPLLRFQGERLLASVGPAGKRLTTAIATDNAKKGKFQVWRMDRAQCLGTPLETLFPSQLLDIDHRHGLLVQLVQTTHQSQSLFSLFNRRGDVFRAFQLSFLVYQLAVNRFSRNHLFGLAYDLPQTGVLIRLQPLKVNRIALNLQPKFIQPFAWGYLLAAKTGEVALLDYEGFLFGNFNVGEPITAIAPMGRYQCLFATWHNGQGNLQLVDLGEKVEDVIRNRQELR